MLVWKKAFSASRASLNVIPLDRASESGWRVTWTYQPGCHTATDIVSMGELMFLTLDNLHPVVRVRLPLNPVHFGKHADGPFAFGVNVAGKPSGGLVLDIVCVVSLQIG